MPNTPFPNILAKLPGAKVLTPMALNGIHFSGRHTVITLKRNIKGKKSK